MGNERDDLKDIENGKIGIIATGIVTVIGAAIKVVDDMRKQNKINELQRERDNIKRKFFNSQQEKNRIKEIDNKIEILKK